VICDAISSMHSANALIPDAEEAIPVECGKLFFVSTSNDNLSRTGISCFSHCRKMLSLGWNECILSPLTSNDVSCELMALTVVVVKAFERVMLREGFAGTWPGFFPQYLMSAIFEGLHQDEEYLPSRVKVPGEVDVAKTESGVLFTKLLLFHQK
jgi:hypothetical protein